LSMTNTLNEKDPRICTNDDLNVLWRIKRKAEDAKYTDLAQCVDGFIVDRARTFLTSDRGTGHGRWFTENDFDASTESNARSHRESRTIRSRGYAAAADTRFWERNFEEALRWYRCSLRADRFQPSVITKYMLLRMGKSGIRFRDGLLALRQCGRRSNSH
jgi:hypothetical protein